jgi:c-di-GMP-binding flagellar brake protein YcgR
MLEGRMQDPARKKTVGEKLDQVITLACQEKSRLKLLGGPRDFPLYSTLVSRRGDQLVISRIEPVNLEESLLLGSEIEIIFPLTSRGYFVGDATFIGPCLDAGKEQWFLIAVPKVLYYIKERRFKRVVPPESLPVTCLSISGRKTAKLVSVRDLNEEGVSLSFPKYANIGRGELLRSIKLRLHGSTYITADAVVRHSFPTNDGRFCLGLMWEPLSRQQHKTLNNYIRLVEESESGGQVEASTETLFFDFDQDSDD